MEKLEKKQYRTIIIATAIVILGAISVIFVYTNKEKEIKRLTSENIVLNDSMLKKDSVMTDLEFTFNEIENNLKKIAEKRRLLAIQENEGEKDQKQAVLANIQLINTMLDENAQRIEELEKQLKQSGLNLNAYSQRITTLSKNIELQNKEIAELKQTLEEKDFQLAELHTAIEAMNISLAKQTDSLTLTQKLAEDTSNELNKGYIAFGTRKELKEKGLLTREGGILGIGSTKLVNDNFDVQYFSTLDIRETTNIALHSSKATIISKHPEESYSFVEENGKIAYLHINNPDEFWRISKYAVIEVKQ